MTTYFTTLSQHNNYGGGTTTNVNTPAHSLVPCDKLIRIEAWINVSITSQGLTAPAITVDNLIWGLQWGLAGYAPADIIAAPFSSAFEWISLIDANSFEHPTWAPSSSTGEQLNIYKAYRLWRAQRPVFQNTDLHLSIANNVGSGTGFVYSTALRVVSTGP